MDLGPLLHPVGRHEPRVYWRRRLVLLVVVAAVVIVAIVAAGGGGDQATLAQKQPSGQPSAPSSPGPTRTSAAPPPSPAAKPAGVVACTADALKLEARTDADRYPDGAEPKLTLLVTNTGSAPCRADLGSTQLELRVLSGEDRVWSSDDCAPDGKPAPEVLEPGEPWAASLTWSRTRSAPTCPGDQPAAGPGTYRLYARLGDRLSEPAVFHLQA